MDSKLKMSGVAIATAAALAFTMAPVTSALAGSNHHKHQIKCTGVNACKGKSSCKTAKSMCKGHNACKGKGFVVVSKKACEQLGGKAKKG